MRSSRRSSQQKSLSSALRYYHHHESSSRQKAKTPIEAVYSERSFSRGQRAADSVVGSLAGEDHVSSGSGTESGSHSSDLEPSLKARDNLLSLKNNRRNYFTVGAVGGSGKKSLLKNYNNIATKASSSENQMLRRKRLASASGSLQSSRLSPGSPTTINTTERKRASKSFAAGGSAVGVLHSSRRQSEVNLSSSNKVNSAVPRSLEENSSFDMLARGFFDQRASPTSAGRGVAARNISPSNLSRKSAASTTHTGVALSSSNTPSSNYATSENFLLRGGPPHLLSSSLGLGRTDSRVSSSQLSLARTESRGENFSGASGGGASSSTNNSPSASSSVGRSQNNTRVVRGNISNTNTKVSDQQQQSSKKEEERKEEERARFGFVPPPAYIFPWRKQQQHNAC